MKVLKSQDILALGFMTFALFVGAGNIIFPPIVGLQSGPHVWMAALGFLINAAWFVIVALFFSSARVRQVFLRLGHWFERSMGLILILFAGRLMLSL